VDIKKLYPCISARGCPLEMGRSSAKTEVQRKNSAECLAQFGSATCDYSAEVRPNFGKDSVLLFPRFSLVTHINLKSLCLLLLTV